MGVRVPKDLAVVGFDGILLSRMLVPSLTTVAQPIYELGRLAAELVLRRSEDPERRPDTYLLKPELQLGASTGRVA